MCKYNDRANELELDGGFTSDIPLGFWDRILGTSFERQESSQRVERAKIKAEYLALKRKREEDSDD